MASTSKRQKSDAANEKKEQPGFILNVGGVKYITSTATLEKYPKSKLTKICFQKKDREVKDEEGINVFIDRDGTLFKFVLNYMRLGKVILPPGFSDTNALLEEVSYYELEDLKRKLEEHKKKQKAVLWVRVVSEGEREYGSQYQNTEVKKATFPKEINVTCLVDTFLGLEFLEDINFDEKFYIHGRSCNRNDLKTWQQETYLSYFFPTDLNFIFDETLEKEGFEKKDSQGDFMMYRYKNSKVIL